MPHEITLCYLPPDTSEYYPRQEIQEVTCHMGSHCVTCYPTQVNITHDKRYRRSPATWDHTVLPATGTSEYYP